MTRRRLGRGSLALAALLLVAVSVHSLWAGRQADRWLEGDPDLSLARGVAARIEGGVAAGDFHTGGSRFDGEWALVTHQMALLGLGQVVLAHPETRDELLPAMEAAADRLLETDLRAFGTSAWGADGLADPDPAHGHAYLGYAALALGMLRLVYPDTPHAAAHDHLAAALADRLAAAAGSPATYPGETYPADIASVVGAVGLHARATGGDSEPARAWSAALVQRFRDPDSGLLRQSTVDGPRGSGTAISAYFLAFSSVDASAALYDALAAHHRSALGYGGVREYPAGVFGLGDVDSGPVLLGIGVSCTGFSIASARARGDARVFRRLVRTASLFGVPLRRGPRRTFLTGGPLGNAIMLAMLTAGPGMDPRTRSVSP